MEQDERMYEYKMGSEVFRFEARTHAEAEEMRGEAIQYFAERAGTLFEEEAIVGPSLAPLPEGFRYVGRDRPDGPPPPIR
jgi:hypothetical protein